tara:strand:- start:3180 stop:3377 length:198 start_codon:yes stop_codon:yes gene_type:complete
MSRTVRVSSLSLAQANNNVENNRITNRFIKNKFLVEDKDSLSCSLFSKNYVKKPIALSVSFKNEA